VLDLDAAEAVAARIVIEHRPAEASGELEAILDEDADEMLDEMDTEEQETGSEAPSGPRASTRRCGRSTHSPPG
jgi:hypothetical protein